MVDVTLYTGQDNYHQVLIDQPKIRKMFELYSIFTVFTYTQNCHQISIYEVTIFFCAFP
jgi:hypothetical protein